MSLTPVAPLKSSMKSLVHQLITDAWSKERHSNCTKGNKRRRLWYHIIRHSKHLTIQKTIYNYVRSRKDVAWLARLRTGHCSLNQYLHQFGILDSALCECQEAEETVSHFLLNCQLYEKERDRLRKKVGAMGMREDKLLGDHNIVRHALDFVRETKRFVF